MSAFICLPLDVLIGRHSEIEKLDSLRHLPDNNHVLFYGAVNGEN
jgi:hypothetical protein